MKRFLVAILLIISIISLGGFVYNQNSKPISKLTTYKTTAPFSRVFLLDATNSRSNSVVRNIPDTIINYKKQYRSVVIDGITYYILEGDLLYDIDEIDFWANDIKKQTTKIDRADKLILMSNYGKAVKWPVGYTIKYCVLQRSFSSSAHYQQVVDSMIKATSDWQNACNIKFQHIKDLDATLDYTSVPDQVDFVVREINANNQFIAQSFFPNDRRDRHKLLLDLSYYTCKFRPTGVLRHELGHILGFRHEHIRNGAPIDCAQNEEMPKDTIPLTSYDSLSVMHYFCGNAGSRNMFLSEKDKIGALQVYPWTKK